MKVTLSLVILMLLMLLVAPSCKEKPIALEDSLSIDSPTDSVFIRIELSEPTYKDENGRYKDKLVGQAEHDLWNLTVSKYLQAELWNDINAYDAGHYLMVPLHAAFELGEGDWQQAFAEHFTCFLNAVKLNEKALTESRLNRLQYLYLASRYIVMAEKNGKNNLVPADLSNFLFNEIYRLWNMEPAWQWARDPFVEGIRERIAWKLENDDTKLARSYYRAIIDEELFLFAIAADLRAYERLTDFKHHHSATIDEVLHVAKTVFLKKVIPQDGGGWLFQPGVWSDHPDYAYAGNLIKHAEMQTKPVPGIAQDSSHSHRFPLWLTSFSDAYGDGTPDKEFYLTLKKGLEKQLFNKVLVMPTEDFPAIRLTNFMDGHNGVYRWEYPTQGEGKGYGPYELSGTFTLGWWSFLGGKRIFDVYRDLSAQFPLPEKVINVYVGPNTLRERHELVSDPDIYSNGFKELIAILSANLARKIQ